MGVGFASKAQQRRCKVFLGISRLVELNSGFPLNKFHKKACIDIENYFHKKNQSYTESGVSTREHRCEMGNIFMQVKLQNQFAVG